MVAELISLSWRVLGKGVAIAYGISFFAGVVLMASGITPQSDQALYPLLALLSGGIGVAVALRVMGTTRLASLAALGIALWLINFSTVLLGAQTLLAWLDSSAFIATTVLLGRLLLGTSLEPMPASVRPRESQPG